MTLFYLVRHGDNDTVGRRIAGRSKGVHLNEAGREQAERIADRLQQVLPQRILSSPLERALETAEPLAKWMGLEVEIDDGFHEIAFGAWEGMPFDELREDRTWRRFHTFRGGTRPPGGELVLEVQARFVAALLHWYEAAPDERMVIVSHGDPIRSAILHFLGMPIDLMLRLEISLGSISTLALEGEGARLLAVNQCDGMPPVG